MTLQTELPELSKQRKAELSLLPITGNAITASKFTEGYFGEQDVVCAAKVLESHEKKCAGWPRLNAVAAIAAER